MSAEENKAVMLRIWKEILNEGRIEKASEFVADDYVYHGPGGHELRGIESFKKLMAWILDSFPGVHFTVDDLFAEGDKVACLFTMKGTHKDGKQVDTQGMMISRFEGGKELEAWDFYDRFAMASQAAPGWVQAMLGLVEKRITRGRP